MKIDIELPRAVDVFVAVFIEDTGCFAVGFTHEVVFALAPETECFGGS